MNYITYNLLVFLNAISNIGFWIISIMWGYGFSQGIAFENTGTITIYILCILGIILIPCEEKLKTYLK